MLSLQEISDRFEIQDLCYHYAYLIDSRDFEGLREVFTADAHIDYSAFGGSVGGVEETLEFLRSAMSRDVFPNSQHLNANMQIRVNGDEASGRIMCFNPMDMADSEGGSEVFLLGLWYVDKYVRTEDGWRMKERSEEKGWVFNAPFMDKT